MSVSWSYSKWADYDNCAFYYKCAHIEKLPRNFGPAMDRGIEVHNLAEAWTKDEIDLIPNELELFESDFELLRFEYKIGNCIPEEQWCFDEDFKPVAWNDWDNAWLRTKVDAQLITSTNHLKIIDHKTGKMRPGYESQLELYALCGFKRYLELEDIQTELWYLDHGEIVDNTAMDIPKFIAPDEKALEKKWRKRVAPMLKDKRFKPRANWKCGYCDFSKKKGGPCEN